MGAKKTTEQFIIEAKIIHKNTYDYSKSVYKGATTKLIITCYMHGDFLLTPSSHMSNKCGCPICGTIKQGLNKRKNIAQNLILKLKNIHKDKYCFDKTIYNQGTEKVIVECYKHGEFYITPKTLLRGRGCRKCGIISRSHSNTYTQEELINEFLKIHLDKYDYSQIVYCGMKEKIVIICKTHGEFTTTPGSHLHAKSGCPRCSIIRRGAKKTNLAKNSFVLKAKLIHDEKYIFDKSIYINNRTKIIVTCPTHGDFEITPNRILAGQGCAICKSSHGERIITNWLNNNNIKFEHQKRFDSCRNIKPMPFDFYIPSINLLIEFDGKQHFQTTSWDKGDVKLLEDRESIDRFKTNWANTNNISLLRIPFTQIKHINAILDIYFQNHNIINSIPNTSSFKLKYHDHVRLIMH